MDKKKKPLWDALNPITWIVGFLQLLVVVFGPILRFFGMLTPPSTIGFENTQVADVDDAKKLAEEQEAAVDALTRELSPAEVVRAYAKADAAGRATTDLSALDLAEQDWLLGLSDEDLDKLCMCTVSGCARSLEQRAVLPIYPKPQPEMETAEILRTPTEGDEDEWKREFVSARFRELFHAPRIPNTNPRYAPTTVH